MTDQELIERYIEQDPYRPGSNGARLRDYGVSVWALIAYYQAAEGDINRVAADYELPPEAVEAALAYYRQHKESIDVRIAEHVATFT
jgi:uncharacterized protein (DUF433 family)